ncbi:MAG: hypothetical protein D3918_09920 [Candidatus Electrothrix sp. AX2]|nr:hypothetical protein [Candidatus Electrothrix gigas]
MVITGINVGKYGEDLNEGENIYSLLGILCSRFTAAGLLLLAIFAISAGIGLSPRSSTIYQIFSLALPQ